MKRLNAKIYAEAKRLGVKWILGGECGHMWRVLHQYMDTMNGPADFLEVPVSPVTGTRFENAARTKMVHICEFTADLIHHGKLKLDPQRNDHWSVTFHDSCNPARAMGLLEEPRYVLKNVCNHFHEMPENTIREQTFCCGSGSGLGTDENLEMRAARRLAARQRREVRAGEARRQPAGLHLRHRQGHAAAADGLLGPRRRGGRRARAGRQRPGHEGRERTDHRPARRAAANRRRTQPMHDRQSDLSPALARVPRPDHVPLWYNLRSRNDAEGARSSKLPRRSKTVRRSDRVHAGRRTWTCSSTGATQVVRDGQPELRRLRRQDIRR